MLRAGADRKFNGLLAPPPFPAGGPAVPGACGAPRMLRQPERPVVRCSAVWTNVSAWPWRTPGAAGVTWGDGLGKGDLGRLGGSGLEPIQHSGPLFQMTWHIPYHHG